MNHEVIDRIYDAAIHEISNILPSEWAEKHRFVPSDVSAMEGMYSFWNAPYAKGMLDCLHPKDPGRIYAIMKGSQLGISTGVVENGVGWIISENPGNILFLVGHESLVDDASKKIDLMIDNTPIRSGDLIRSSSNKARKTKSGDTTNKKEFAGGELKLGIANHKYLRNISMRYGFIDDYDAMRSDTKESGSTFGMIESRFKAFWKKMKLYLISSPEILETSNINEAYLKGDQRKYHVPCPCCGEKIVWEWEVKNKANPGEHAGITYALDENYKLIPESVGYTCQECGEFFDDRNKSEIINQGEWIPTKNPKDIDPDIVSFHISSLYAPTFMKGWLDYVKEYLEANPPNGVRDEKKHQVFMNQCLGLPYEQQGQSASAENLRKNTRDYQVGEIPETLSIEDGNGRIVLLTLGADMNGKEDDARIDWEVVAWTESGSSYSVDHGSVGTFIPAENQLPDDVRDRNRIKWTYRQGHKYSVWEEFEEVFQRKYKTDTGRTMVCIAGCLDSGYLATEYAYPYVDSTPLKIYAVKGDKEHNPVQIDGDYKPFKQAQERNNLWMLNVNRMKDVLFTQMNLTWHERMVGPQPSGFMNFPQPSNGKYTEKNYFSHFEAEEKVIGNDHRFIWRKKKSNSQNHQFDCRIYSVAARDIFVNEFFTAYKVKRGNWSTFVKSILGNKALLNHK